MDANEDTLFDLIGTLDDQRRALDAAALWDDPVRSARRRQKSRAQAMTVARITRELAQQGRRHTILSSRDIEGYVDSLIDACVDDGADPRAGEGLVPAPPRKVHRRHGGTRKTDNRRSRGRP